MKHKLGLIFEVGDLGILQAVTLLLVALIVWSGQSSVTFAMQVEDVIQEQDDQDDQNRRRSELGERQRLVERKMATLESMFESIAQKLQATEPERAQRLEQALQQAKENLIKRKMNEITVMLDQQRLSEAEREMNEVIESLDALIRLLLNEQEETSSKQKQIEDLERWKQQLESLRKEEREQRLETEKVADKDKAIDDLDQQAKQIKELIQKQQAVIDETVKNADRGLQALDRVADQQFEVRKETEDLVQQIGRKSGSDSNEPVDGGEPADGSDPAESQSGDGEAEPSQPQGGQPTSGEPGEQQPGQSQPGQSQAQPQPSESDRSSPPGQKPLQQATRQQRQAEESLGRGKPDEAQRAEQRALDQLNEALSEIEKEKKRIESLPPEALKEMANTQRRTKDKTADVASEMKKSPSAADESQQADGQRQPGQQHVENAQQAMENAAAELDDEEPQRAERQQRKAEDDLAKALQEIEERLNQLREETREEKLRRLEARFREMLVRQQMATTLTSDLHDKLTYLGRLRRRDTLSLLRLATEERDISELGQQAYDLLLEDGTSIVFPEMVQDVREDLGRVAQLLEADETGALTQMVQHQIEDTLGELLDALKRSREQRESQGGGGGGGGNQPLLRKSAELKMLRAAQLRVNRRTIQFDMIRGNDKLESFMKQEVQAIADRQAEITEMTLRVLEDE